MPIPYPVEASVIVSLSCFQVKSGLLGGSGSRPPESQSHKKTDRGDSVVDRSHVKGREEVVFLPLSHLFVDQIAKTQFEFSGIAAMNELVSDVKLIRTSSNTFRLQPML